MNLFVLTDDLMFQSQVSGPLARAGIELKFLSDPQRLTALDLTAGDPLVVVDLNTANVDIPAIGEWARRHSLKVIGVASHVHLAKIEAAQKNGFCEVVSRGQVGGQLGPLVQSYLGGGPQ